MKRLITELSGFCSIAAFWHLPLMDLRREKAKVVPAIRERVNDR